MILNANYPPINTTAWFGWCPNCMLPFNNHRLDCGTIAPRIVVDPAFTSATTMTVLPGTRIEINWHAEGGSGGN